LPQHTSREGQIATLQKVSSVHSDGVAFISHMLLVFSTLGHFGVNAFSVDAEQFQWESGGKAAGRRGPRV
jgi:hypothetical protein